MKRGDVSPLVLEADERPLDVEHVVSDHVGLAIFHQKPEQVHGLLGGLLTQHVAHQAQVDVGWETRDTLQQPGGLRVCRMNVLETAGVQR